MEKRFFGRAMGSILMVLATTGCGGSDDAADDDGACTTPRLTGNPVFFPGTATLSGSGVLLPGPPDGHELELMIGDGIDEESVYPDGISLIPTVCGSSFTYEITELGAGTYTLTYNVYDPNSNDFTPTFTATSTNSITVADGTSVTFNPTF